MDLLTDPQYFEKACVMVTLAFLLTRTRLFPNLLRARLTLGELGAASLLFIVLGFAEIATTSSVAADSPLNLRIVAVATAGLLAGPWVGLVVGVAVTAMAVGMSHQAIGPIAISMCLAGLIGGFVCEVKPRWAGLPATGLVLGIAISLMRNGLNALVGSPTQSGVWFILGSAVLQGCSVALILGAIGLARKQEFQAKALALAELRELRARMNPHFLYNSLNTISALSQVQPDAVPAAAAKLATFLRASLDEADRLVVTLREELRVVKAYGEVEGLRFGDRLSIRYRIPESLEPALVPPFLIQPLVENAVRHGISPSEAPGRIDISVSESMGSLVVTVSDNGVGFEAGLSANTMGDSAHALQILRRRLEGLYPNRCKFLIESTPGKGTVVTARLPLTFAPAESWPLSDQIGAARLVKG